MEEDDKIYEVEMSSKRSPVFRWIPKLEEIEKHHLT
jgi:hypothetical protein